MSFFCVRMNRQRMEQKSVDRMIFASPHGAFFHDFRRSRPILVMGACFMKNFLIFRHVVTRFLQEIDFSGSNMDLERRGGNFVWIRRFLII